MGGPGDQRRGLCGGLCFPSALRGSSSHRGMGPLGVPGSGRCSRGPARQRARSHRLLGPSLLTVGLTRFLAPRHGLPTEACPVVADLPDLLSCRVGPQPPDGRRRGVDGRAKVWTRNFLCRAVTPEPATDDVTRADHAQPRARPQQSECLSVRTDTPSRPESGPHAAVSEELQAPWHRRAGQGW